MTPRRLHCHIWPSCWEDIFGMHSMSLSPTITCIWGANSQPGVSPPHPRSPENADSAGWLRQWRGHRHLPAVWPQQGFAVSLLPTFRALCTGKAGQVLRGKKKKKNYLHFKCPPRFWKESWLKSLRLHHYKNSILKFNSRLQEKDPQTRPHWKVGMS